MMFSHMSVVLLLGTIALGSGACNNGTECSSGTCCTGSDGGCCLYSDGACCSDGLHCCPKDTVCNLVFERCDTLDTGETLPWMEKIASTPIQFNDVIKLGHHCADHSKCPGEYTCCELRTKGKFGCCPEGDATCCSDHIHCCPSGLKCDLVHQTCIKNLEKQWTPWHAVIRAVNTICPDQRSECPGTETCCKMGSEFGCCPYEQATCCSDEIHCCPSQMVCSSAGTCTYSVEEVADNNV